MVRKTVVIALALLLLSGGASGFAAPAPVKLRVGIVAAIDQLGTPVALDRGFFEKWGLDVTIANPFPTGVDLLNALQAGEIQMGQVGVPMIGAVLRGMDLVEREEFEAVKAMAARARAEQEALAARVAALEAAAVRPGPRGRKSPGDPAAEDGTPAGA